MTFSDPNIREATKNNLPTENQKTTDAITTDEPDATSEQENSFQIGHVIAFSIGGVLVLVLMLGAVFFVDKQRKSRKIHDRGIINYLVDYD